MLKAGRFFRPGTPAPDLHSVRITGGREADAFSTHGVNCTGSCRWKVYVFGAIDTLRIPLEYLAELFTAGDVGPVRASLEKLAAMRSHMLALNLGETPDPSVPAAVGDARRLEESALPQGCRLDYEGGPGMGGDGPFGQDSGRKLLRLVSVENFHVLRRRQTSDDAEET
nr:hypothetical protein [Streptomyces cupreus]